MDTSKKNIFSFIKERPYFGYFALLFFLFFLAQFITELSIGKFELNDFRVYYSAAQNYWKGEDVYGVQYGLDTGFYKYSPVILLVYTPFIALPYTLAAAIYYLLNLVVIVFLFYRFIRLIETYFSFQRKHGFILLLILQLSFLGHFLRELHLGNTNLLLLFSAILAIDAILKNRVILSGLLLSILILTKPYFGLLILPVLLTKNYRILYAWMMSTATLTFGSILVFGWTKAYHLHIEWIFSMKDHSNYLSSNNTIIHIVNSLFKSSIPDQLGLILYASFSLGIFYFFWAKQKLSNQFIPTNFILFVFLLLAIFPNFLVTDTEHFLFSFGLICLLVLQLFEQHTKWLWLPFSLLIILYLGESNLFLTRSMSDSIKLSGGMGLANLVLISWSLFLFYRNKSTN